METSRLPVPGIVLGVVFVLLQFKLSSLRVLDLQFKLFDIVARSAVGVRGDVGVSLTGFVSHVCIVVWFMCDSWRRWRPFGLESSFRSGCHDAWARLFGGERDGPRSDRHRSAR